MTDDRRNADIHRKPDAPSCSGGKDAPRRLRHLLAPAILATVAACAIVVGAHEPARERASAAVRRVLPESWRNALSMRNPAPVATEAATPPVTPGIPQVAASRRQPHPHPLGLNLPPPPEALKDPLLVVNDRPIAPPPTGVPSAPLRAALNAYRSGQAPEGDAIAAGIADPVARALLEWTAIRYAGPQLDFNRISRFITANPDWPALHMARRQAEYALMRAKAPPARVISYFAARTPETPHGKLMLAEARRATGDADGATRLIVDMWRNDALPAALESKVVEAFGAALPQSEHRNRMEHFLLGEDWSTALRAANRAGGDFVKLARARMAVAQARQPGKAAEAALNAVPEALRKDVSWRLSRAIYLRKRDDNEGALAIHMATPVADLATDGGDAWWVERRILARRYLDTGKPDVAYRLVQNHGAERDSLKIEAEFHAGWIALRYLKQPQAALKHFNDAARVAGTPVSVSRTAYWRGRALEALGDAKAALAAYEEAAAHGAAFYGQAARIKLAEKGGVLTRAPVAPPDALDATAVRAIRLLHEAGADDMASPLYLDVARSQPDPGVVDLVARLAANRNDARSMVAIGKAAMQRGLPLVDVAWPVQGAPAFTPARQDVERPLVLAIARQESVFDPGAVSSAGARGLMQLMPATAQRTASRAGKPYDVNRLTSDPAYNAELGAHHLGELLDDWRGSYILTIAAYNAGGGNVKKWIENHGDPRDPGVDPIDWIELIPFSETRNYVQRVLENLQVYREKLQPGAAMQLAFDLRRGVRNPQDAPVPPSQVALLAAGADHSARVTTQTTSSIRLD